ncbi:cation-translocating P-type ATPase [Marinibacterium sp. SX1]|uniref:cation-translocating P-type ATPase n=1 Tax=Marinibacterium sp. SX1 TaxID=3388424 RepID=UPI003D172D30
MLDQEHAGTGRPYLVAAGQAALGLGADPDRGLSSDEAAARLARHGPNKLAEARQASALDLLIEQLKNPLLVILMIGAVISAYTGHWVDAVAIFVIVLINAGIGFWQEYSAQKSMAALSAMAAPHAMVLRDGQWADILAADLVPGDILRLKAGDIVPADIRLVDAARLEIDEAALTGESEPVDKHTDPLAPDAGEDDITLADRRNMGFMSTLVTGGTGLGLVTATGMQTEVGHIAGLMAAAEEPRTPLQERIDALSRVLMGAAFLVVAIVIGIGLSHGMDAVEMLNTAISLSVAAIPEGLPTVVTIVLTLGSQAMARENALVRKLSSVETLGTTSVICSDKTGTLTQNQMQVMRVWTGGQEWQVTGEGFDPRGAFVDDAGQAVEVAPGSDLMRMLQISAYCNEAVLTETDGRAGVQGNPTDGALMVAAAKAGLTREGMEAEHGVRRLRVFPFDSSRKMMSILVDVPGMGRMLAAKGAPDVILSHASHLLQDGQAVPLTDDHRAWIEGIIAGFGAEALRTLAVAYKAVPDDHPDNDMEHHEQDIVLVGIHGIMDPPRSEVRDAVADAASAGVRVVMITGDHAVTAEAIARSIGIKTRDDQTVHTGAELNATSDEELVEKVRNAAVFARVTPEHKLRIVRALQENQLVTAMTGDGVNDAPALRTADIGIAMGITGTSVAKDSASLILLDDNFSTIVGAVREGRRIYDNLRKFVRQGLTANVAEVFSILLAFLLMGQDPQLTLAPLMILWINLVSDGLPALALGVEPAEDDIMRKAPRGRGESLFAEGLKERIMIRGLAIGGLTYYAFHAALQSGASVDYAQTTAFATLIFAQLWHIFDSRTTTTLFQRNPLENRVLLGAVALSAGLSLLAIYTAPGQFVLGTTGLALHDLVGCFFLAALPTLGLSAIKALFGWRWL